MKLVIGMRFPAGLTKIEDGLEIPDTPGGWAYANRRATLIGNKAIELLETLRLTSGTGWRMRKVARELNWTAWKNGGRSSFITVRLKR